MVQFLFLILGGGFNKIQHGKNPIAPTPPPINHYCFKTVSVAGVPNPGWAVQNSKESAECGWMVPNGYGVP